MVQTNAPGAGLVWRIAHNYNSSSEFVPGAIEDDGSGVMWTTDFDGMVGCLDGVTQLCPAGPDFVASTFYPFNAIVNPTAGNINHYLWQVVAQGTSSVAPAWLQTPGAMETTGGVTFQNTGIVANSAGPRTDVFFAGLTSSAGYTIGSGTGSGSFTIKF